ncbi:MAG: cysteine synthase A [Peptostreptococcaceae bacterium]|nr:cysteine synthase A [Peptostreptococcaceae bacterium]
MVYESILDLIGKTPSVRLNKIVEEDMAEIYVKLECFNPSGSVKDRAALGMIRDLAMAGKLPKGSTIVEPTSGNTGIGIAMIGAVKGYKVVLTMPDTLSVERRRMLSAYGAELVLTEGAKGMKGAVEKAQELVELEGYIMLSQFDNESNPKIHKHTTAMEILDDFSNLDAVVAGVGTGGTVSGVAEGMKNAMPNIRIVAVEPAESAVLSGNAPSPHKIQGIGAGFVPENYNADLIDEVMPVAEKEAFEITKKLATEEGIFVGISSGAAVWAALQVAKKLGKGKRVLAILPDGGNRYLSIDGLF